MNEEALILVVENDDDDALLLLDAFHRAGILNPIKILVNAEQAIDYVSGTGAYDNREDFPAPSLIFSDLPEPITEALEVVRWSKSLPQFSQIPVIVMTDSDDREILKEAYDAGANLAFCKPADDDKLTKALRLCCEHLLVT